ncbi:MAG: MBL fold metallo-hydrolase [Lachnospiraceae bacterium]
MKVSILTENIVYKRGYIGEHGLSLFIEHDNLNYLFDTGQSSVFTRNAHKMKINLKKLDGIILSHGHYDHCNGLEEWLKEEKELTQQGMENPRIPIYINEKAFQPKYTGIGENRREIGITWKLEDWKDKLNLTQSGLTQIAENVYLLSQISYVTEFEPKSDLFFKEEIKGIPISDDMEEEQLLIIKTEKGLNVFAGCAHPGIINCVSAVQRAFPEERIYSLIGGMHLLRSHKLRVENTIKVLDKLGIEIIVPLHCTGMLAIAAMKEALGERCILGETGKRIIL